MLMDITVVFVVVFVVAVLLVDMSLFCIMLSLLILFPLTM